MEIKSGFEKTKQKQEPIREKNQLGARDNRKLREKGYTFKVQPSVVFHQWFLSVLIKQCPVRSPLTLLCEVHAPAAAFGLLWLRNPDGSHFSSLTGDQTLK